ncbi:MAG: tail fiber domain-containing protein [Chthoniobacterales bacterium]
MASESGRIRIGTTGTHTDIIVAGIRDNTVAGGVTVLVGNNGKLGTTLSSARFKHRIKPMDQASEAILALNPVTFRYKEELDSEGIPQFGLIAEEVEKVNPDLVARDADGKVNTVRYEAVNAMLLNEFLKQHRDAQEQRTIVAALKSSVAQQEKRIEELHSSLKDQAAQIQKVTEKAQTRKRAQAVAQSPVASQR